MEFQIRTVEQIVKYFEEFYMNKFAFHRKHELSFCIL